MQVQLLFANEATRSVYVMWTRAVLFYLNNIIIPCFATLLTDPSCFVTLIFGNQAPRSIETIFPNCLAFSPTTGECTATGFGSGGLMYLPGFVYNDQCSSAVLTNYIPVFVYSYTFQVAE